MAYSKDNINYSKCGFHTKREKQNPLDPPLTNFFFDIIKYFNSNLVPKSEYFNKIFGDSKIKSEIYAHIKKKLKDVKGSGIKKGCRMQPIEETKEIDRFNEDIRSGERQRKQENAGASSDAFDIPKVINFGKNKLLLNKLYYNNVLSVEDSKMHSIESLKNQHVSDDFVKVIYSIYNNKSNNDANLSDKELELFHLLLFVSGLNKKKNIDIKREDSITKLKERLLLVESQINTGNDNPAVLDEMKQIIKKSYLYKAISLTNAKLYINQFNK